ncbi:MAG: lysine exporter LysO family protein [Exilispira sp.]
MLIIIVYLISGILIGYILREKKILINLISKLLQMTIYLLLFVMGYKLADKNYIFATEKNLFFQSVISVIILFIVFLLYSFIKSRLIKSIIKFESNKKYKLQDRKEFNNSQNIIDKNYIEKVEKLDENKNSFNKYSKDEDRNYKTKNLLSFNEIIAVLINIGFIILGFIFYFLLNNLFKIKLNEEIINDISEKVLYILILFVGMDLGRNLLILKNQRLKVENFFLPFESILLSFISSILFYLIFKKKLLESMIIYGGLGWYSLSSVLLSVKGFTILAMYSFIHNVFREIIAIISAPIVAKIDPHLPILIGGATSMDVMLGFVQKYSGSIYTLASFYSGAICSISVSFIINGLMALLK